MNLRIANEELKKLHTKIYSFQENETKSSKENVDYFNESRTFINDEKSAAAASFSKNTSILNDKQIAEELENLIRTFDI
jgi:hypothetical protein